MIFTAAFGVALALLEYFVYFPPDRHFFNGDTFHWFYLRHHTIGDFLLSFIRLDPAGWYRPLTNRTVQSLFYPLFGMAPAGYRAVHYALFMSVILAAYKLATTVTRRRMAAVIATVFFGMHTVNAYTTYDVLFTPEVVYTFFYLCAVMAYLRRRNLASVAFFTASLCSKEAAVTLPIMLMMLDVILNRTHLIQALAAARAHLAVMAVYVVLVFGYLGVQRPAFQSILKRPGPEVSYRFAADQTILKNADYALTWAFNIPRGWQTQSRQQHGWTITFLKIFRGIIALLGIWMLFQPERPLVIAGFLWFFIAAAPALPLFEHFLPYYLFLPLAGFSIAIGVVVEAAYRKAAAYNKAVAGSAGAVVFYVLAVICAVAAQNDARDNRVLGWSSRLAENSMNDLKNAHPALQPNTTIYISDAAEPDLAWDTSQGELFKMAYNDETLHTLYWGWGEVITKGALERGPLIVMKYEKFHLTEVTPEFLAASEPPVSYRASGKYKLEITPAAATAGQKYRLSIAGLSNADVKIHYTLNGGPVHAFDAHLDENHRAAFDVSGSTEKGLYKFVGFRLPGSEEDWRQAAASIRID